jgi:hypothetical protein
MVLKKIDEKSVSEGSENDQKYLNQIIEETTQETFALLSADSDNILLISKFVTGSQKVRLINNLSSGFGIPKEKLRNEHITRLFYTYIRLRNTIITQCPRIIMKKAVREVFGEESRISIPEVDIRTLRNYLKTIGLFSEHHPSNGSRQSEWNETRTLTREIIIESTGCTRRLAGTIMNILSSHDKSKTQTFEDLQNLYTFFRKIQKERGVFSKGAIAEILQREFCQRINRLFLGEKFFQTVEAFLIKHGGVTLDERIEEMR